MTARGESSRNAPRTSSRNSAALDRLIFELGARKFPWMLYQYCAGCKQFEALILATTDPERVTPPSHVLSLSKSLGVPVFVVCHSAKDEDMLQPVDVHAYESDGTILSSDIGVSWLKAAQLLMNTQLAHQGESASTRCANHDSTLLKKGGWKLNDGDASVSNLARMIPGVRHIDFDAAIYCPRCSRPQAIIEASSDGMENTDLSSKTKGICMSLEVARTVGADAYLLQHHVRDAAHQHPAMLTEWRSGDAAESPSLASSTMTWGSVRRTLRSSQARHVCKIESP